MCDIWIRMFGCSIVSVFGHHLLLMCMLWHNCRLYERVGFERVVNWVDPLWLACAEKGMIGPTRRVLYIKQLPSVMNWGMRLDLSCIMLICGQVWLVCCTAMLQIVQQITYISLYNTAYLATDLVVRYSNMFVRLCCRMSLCRISLQKCKNQTYLSARWSRGQQYRGSPVKVDKSAVWG